MKPAVSHYSASWASHSCTFKTGIFIFILFMKIIPGYSQQRAIELQAGIPVSSLHDFKSTAAYTPPLSFADEQKDSLAKIKRRVRLVAMANVVGYAGSMTGLYSAWYKQYPQSHFHTFNDIKEWQQMDKLGHIMSAYGISKGSMEIWRWTGIDRKKRIWLGGITGAAYQTVIEVLDGFSTEWGWSWGDIGANMIGSGTFIAQELAWDDQRIQFKYSFHRKSYNDASLNDRSDILFGKNTVSRFLKDYNGTTFWISVTPKSFFPESKLPAWLQFSIGTGAEGMFGAFDNTGKDKQGNIIFNRPDIKRYRQWYLAPDIDLTKIKTNKKGIRLLLDVLNIFKFPAPAMELSNGKIKIKGIAF